MKWMQWALNGRGKVGQASIFHLTGLDHKSLGSIFVPVALGATV
ncbi:MAG: hypothetical protein ACR2IS_02990 [Nitrososphaeraceae archaeon]